MKGTAKRKTSGSTIRIIFLVILQFLLSMHLICYLKL
nr:MAG TPA: hypothetical protein [Caudoviricetes sp.]